MGAAVPKVRNPVHEPSHQNPQIEGPAVMSTTYRRALVRSCGPGRLRVDQKIAPARALFTPPTVTKTASYNRLTRPETPFLNALPDRFTSRFPSVQH